MSPTVPRPVLLLLLPVAALLLAAPTAAAHATLVDTSPGDGTVVDTPPTEVVLTFSEDVSLPPDALRVLAPDGSRADTGDPHDRGTDDPARHSVTLPEDLADGTYTVTWQAVSADSHPISGAFTFSVGAPSETTVDPDAAAGTTGGSVAVLYDASRYAAYAGFVLLVGGSAFVLLCWPRAARLARVQRLIIAGWSTTAGGTLALLLLRHPYTGSGRLADALDLAGVRAVIETDTGTALTSRLLLLAASGLFLAVLFGSHARLPDTDDARRRDLTHGLAIGGTVLACGIAATWALAEHATTGPQTALAVPSHIVHLLAVAAWLGGLATLLLALYREPAVPRSAVTRFSALAVTSVLTLATTGGYQAWRQLGTWSDLTGTAYGRLLTAKVALIATMLAAARLSRRWTARLADPPDATPEPAPEPDPGPEPEPQPPGATATDPLRAAQLERQRRAREAARRRKTRDADRARSGLRRTVLVETLLAAAVLAVTTALAATAPARTEADGGDDGGPRSLSMPFDTGGDDGQGRALLDLDPARPGSNTLHIRTVDTDGDPLPVEEIRVAATLPDEDLGPLRSEPAPVDADHWVVDDLALPRPGTWELSLTVRTSEIDQTTVVEDVPVP